MITFQAEDESDSADESPALKRRKVQTAAERKTRTSKGRLQRVVERVKRKEKHIYKEAGVLTTIQKESKLSQLERLKEIKVLSIPKDEFDEMDLEKKVDHIALNMGTLPKIIFP